MRTILVAALLAGAVAFELRGNHPVQKVVNLLHDMKSSVEEDKVSDKAVYDKFACWCNVNQAEKEAAIKKNEDTLKDKEAKTLELTALVEKTQKEIEALEAEIKKKIQDREGARDILEKETKAFNEKYKDELEYKRALQSAIVILKKHHTESFQQVSEALKAGLNKGWLARHAKEAMLIQGFMTKDYFGAQAVGDGAYANQSGTIIGVLENMLDTFEKSLGDDMKEHETRLEHFKALEQEADEAIENARKQLAAKKKLKADSEVEISDSAEIIKEAKKALAADTSFLMDLRLKCQDIAKKFEERTKTRDEEAAAIDKTLEVLTSDKAEEAFNAAYNKGAFLQVASRVEGKRRNDAAKVLQVTGSPKLIALAVQVRLAAFDKVKKAIDDMIDQLQKDQAEEVTHKNFCIDGIAKNEKNTKLAQEDLKSLDADLKDTENKISEMNDRMETIKEEVAELEKQMKRATDNRARQNDEFQTSLKEQRAAYDLLKTAHEILMEFYGKKHDVVEGEAKSKDLRLVQEDPVKIEKPAGFAPFKKAAAGGPLGLVKMIMGDISKEMSELENNESDSQQAYEEFGRDTNKTLKQRSEEVASLTGLVGKAEEKKNTLVGNIKDKNDDIDGLEKENTEYHGSCDFTLKNFDIRQKARMEEITALRHAKTILNGAKFSQFLQRH